MNLPPVFRSYRRVPVPLRIASALVACLILLPYFWFHVIRANPDDAGVRRTPDTPPAPAGPGETLALESGDHGANTLLPSKSDASGVFLAPAVADSLTARDAKAGDLLAAGKHAEAETELRALLIERSLLLGPEHSDTLRTRYSLARVLHHQSKYVEAEAEHAGVRDIRTRVLGPEHSLTLVSRHATASEVISRGFPEKVEDELRAVWSIRERVLGPEHQETLASAGDFNGPGRWMYSQHELQLMEAKDRARIADREQTFGPDDGETLMLRFGRIHKLVLLDRNEEALREAGEVYAGFRRVLGDGHESTMIAGAFLEDRKRIASEKPYGIVPGTSPDPVRPLK